MTCQRCGGDAQGQYCQDCEREVSQGIGAGEDVQTTGVPETDTIPPRPAEVLADERVQWQAMTALSDDDYAALAEDIRENGVLQPVIVDDSDEQVIIDGHHREAIAKYYDLPEEKRPAYVVVSGMDDDAKLSRAIKQNLIGRDTTDAVKEHAVKQYIELSWDRTDDGDLIRPETNQEVADKLGVSRQLVDKVLRNATDSIIKHDRLRAREYYEENPDASYREVARQVDATNATVTDWLKEDFDEGDEDEVDDDQETLAVTARDKSEAEKTAEVTRKATASDGGTATETAKEQAGRLARNETSPQTASKTVEQEEAEQEIDDERNPDSEGTATIEHADAVAWLNRQSECDALITDPPFTTDVDNVVDFAEEWVPAALEAIADDGYAYIFIGSYVDELYAYTSVLRASDYYVQPLVWNYRNTLGRSPSDRYKRDWQCVLYCRGPDAGDLNAPKTSELRSVQEVNAPGMVGDDSERHHRWQKPDDLIEQFVRHATDEGETVIDPFAGSGQHLLTAAKLGRDANGCDNDPWTVGMALWRGCER